MAKTTVASVPNGIVTLFEVEDKGGTRRRGPFTTRTAAETLARGAGLMGFDAPVDDVEFIVLDGIAYRKVDAGRKVCIEPEDAIRHEAFAKLSPEERQALGH